MTAEIFIEEKKELIVETKKVKKKRKPLSEEAKEKLRDRLKKARESKVLKKKESTKSITIETMPLIKEEEEVSNEVSKEVVLEETKGKDESVKISTALTDLQNELNNLKLEKLEALEKKNEKKKNQIAKRKATMERKALEKASKNQVAKPAPVIIRNVIPIDTEPIPKVKKYSTYKKSIWSTL